MNRENCLKWAEELESGRWQQCRDTMHSASRREHCCLGVADKLGPNAGDYDAVYKWLGFDAVHFIDMNDGAHMSFERIAEEIRKMLG